MTPTFTANPKAEAWPALLCAQAIGEHLRQRPELFPSILSTLFEIALFENCTNQWSLSRPMLPLILLNEQVRRRGQGLRKREGIW